ncbi:MAG: 1-acyl-sn-glycerol-3-phosphate acyltransferase [bacterium]
MFWKHYDIDSLDNVDFDRIETYYRYLHGPLERYFRSEVRGLHRIPRGAGLYVANHSGGIITPDSFIFGCALYREQPREDLPYGLGHDVINWPVVNQIVGPIGAVRASHANAHRIFAAGKKVLVYPGGDVDNMRPWRHRYRIVFGGRTGYVRLALRESVPIIPVVSAGGHNTFIVIDDLRWLARLLRVDKLIRSHVWPLVLSIPWGLTVGVIPVYIPWPAKILMEVGRPITFARTGPDAAADGTYVRLCADEVEDTLQRMLDRLAAELRR